jgi:tetratricopeptide (TPR) repeat protein
MATLRGHGTRYTGTETALKHVKRCSQRVVKHFVAASLAFAAWLVIGQALIGAEETAPAPRRHVTAKPVVTVKPIITTSTEPIALDASVASATASGTTPFDVSKAAAPASDLEAKFFADAADGQLDEFTPLGAALVASGVTDPKALADYEQKAAKLVEEIRRTDRCNAGQRALVEAVFEYMHFHLLRGGYHIDNTDLRDTLDQGRFNCVTASILFNYLTNALGVECRGLAMPGHAMSRVMLAKGPLDIETTCPNWFLLLANAKSPAEIKTVPVGTSTVVPDRSKVQEVTPCQMAAMIYYNHGVDLLAQKRFAAAAVANAKALRLDPQNATARGNLLATLNNWSIDLGSREQFTEAVNLLRQGLLIEPKYDAFAQNYVHVHHQWVDSLRRTGRYDEALEILSRAVAEMPDQQYLRRAQSEVSEQLAKAISSQHTSNAAPSPQETQPASVSN